MFVHQPHLHAEPSLSASSTRRRALPEYLLVFNAKVPTASYRYLLPLGHEIRHGISFEVPCCSLVILRVKREYWCQFDGDHICAVSRCNSVSKAFTMIVLFNSDTLSKLTGRLQLYTRLGHVPLYRRRYRLTIACTLQFIFFCIRSMWHDRNNDKSVQPCVTTLFATTLSQDHCRPVLQYATCKTVSAQAR